MKHSPHRYKQLRKKAVRKFSQVDLSKESQKTQSMGKFLQGATFSNLMPFDHDRAHEMIHFFKKHQERMTHLQNSPHHSKRTTPGEVEGEGPYTFFKHHKAKSFKHSDAKNVEKSTDLARKVLKFQNDTHHKKAA